MTSNPPKRTHALELDSANNLPAPKKPCPPAPTSIDLWKIIRKLPIDVKDAILHKATKEYPSLIVQIQEAEKVVLAAELARPIETFSEEKSRAYDVLSVEEHKQWGADFDDPVDELNEILDAVLESAGDETRYETRSNAIDALGQVIETILDDRSGVVESEFTDGGREMLLKYVEGIGKIAGTMNGMEREMFVKEGNLMTLKALAKRSKVMKLEEVSKILEGASRETGCD